MIFLYLRLGTRAWIVTIVSTPGLIISQLLFIHFHMGTTYTIAEQFMIILRANYEETVGYWAVITPWLTNGCVWGNYPRCSCRRIPPDHAQRNAVHRGASWVTFSGSSTVSITFSGSTAGLGLAPGPKICGSSQIRHLKGRPFMDQKGWKSNSKTKQIQGAAGSALDPSVSPPPRSPR